MAKEIIQFYTVSLKKMYIKTITTEKKELQEFK